MKLFRRRKRARLSDILSTSYADQDVPVILASTSDFDDAFVAFRYATRSFEIEVSRRMGLVSVDISRRADDAGTLTSYAYEDVRAALGDDHLPASPPEDLREVTSLLANLGSRMETLFADKSELKLKLALQDRRARNAATYAAYARKWRARTPPEA